MVSPVDVGGLLNHVKYCVSVLSLQWAKIRTSPLGIPYMVGGRCLTGSSLTGALIVQIDFMVVVVDRICCGFAARSRKKN